MALGNMMSGFATHQAQAIPISHFGVLLIDLTALLDVCGLLPARFGSSQQIKNRVTTEYYAVSWTDKVLDQHNCTSLVVVKTNCGEGVYSWKALGRIMDPNHSLNEPVFFPDGKFPL